MGQLVKLSIFFSSGHIHKLAGWVSIKNEELIGAPLVGQNSLKKERKKNELDRPLVREEVLKIDVLVGNILVLVDRVDESSVQLSSDDHDGSILDCFESWVPSV